MGLNSKTPIKNIYHLLRALSTLTITQKVPFLADLFARV